MNEISLFDGAAWFVVFLFSTTLHEAAHAWSALKLGDDTAHRGGQVTLDPTPHIKREPFGMVLVPMISYALSGWMMGWASAPYDPEWARRYPRRAAWMSMAGPASNFALVIIAALLIHLGIWLGFFEIPKQFTFDEIVAAKGDGIPFLCAKLLSIMFSLNVLLCAFNLLPVPPLDGSSIPYFFIPEETAEKYSELLRSPGIGIFGMVIAWKLFGTVFWPLLKLAISLLYPSLSFN